MTNVMICEWFEMTWNLVVNVLPGIILFNQDIKKIFPIERKTARHAKQILLLSTKRLTKNLTILILIVAPKKLITPNM